MLTAIVVGFATMSVGLALIYQIKREYGTVNESEIEQRNIG
jgi:multisubunit Na+/H+ antiporter MnhC subunit